MIASPHIDRLSALAGDYDALLCDAWGVIHDGVNLFAGVEEALDQFPRALGAGACSDKCAAPIGDYSTPARSHWIVARRL